MFSGKDNEINDILLKKEDRRKNYFKELCETEKSYIQSLEILHHVSYITSTELCYH